uniref:Uncharacterized protein n=1 Tax=OCS116 cluster bacterium TaxID=2030921 RepID=A0A2A4YZI1_9PROT
MVQVKDHYLSTKGGDRDFANMQKQLMILVDKAIYQGLFKSQSAPRGAILLLEATSVYHQPSIIAINVREDMSTFQR